ncbi:MAG TPA: UvrB/UvrC motif-containing protein [Spirochaetota bacterium]|nr:UvrB/UvrC motif-containing protein [Spirochaetota bacterium]HOD15040.1 UvrB/UvrC motif-containing protein [Spirochaetota bacterium]HPG49399.1 UvrB/UvrC motif-containing protein [Spirochaetota bacterium]HPN12063.1 UvrB/UvrC motif-containing protein [Spirochaetota bacterium]
MLCERCRNIEATIHLTEIIKDVKSEVHLCESCAREIGLNSKLSSFSLSIPEMLSFLDVSEIEEYPAGSVCKSCGLSFMDYSRENKLGCPDCYVHLKDSLKSVIAGYHGAARHVGKQPSVPGSIATDTYVRTTRTVTIKKSLDDLKNQLKRAVYEERYEEAAVLRDRINDMERNKGSE